ncbi:hypothetical protein OAH97_01970 [Octadecabacter sp.]|nr:hypothetical protein [Octadecabacter sp.]
MRDPICSAALCLMPHLAQADTLDLLFTEPVGGVYTQDWFGHLIGSDRGRGTLMFIRGDGKNGNFYGVLSIDCAAPENSAWVSTGGVISSDYVPRPAIAALRARACAAPSR